MRPRITIVRSSFEENRAHNTGGALHVNGHVEISDSTFSGNVAAGADPVALLLTIGSRVFCAEYGGEVSFRAGSTFRARRVPPPAGVPNF
ncbi:MAG: hypothetical protein ACE5FG_04030 [Myxococcota bacterium]